MRIQDIRLALFFTLALLGAKAMPMQNGLEVVDVISGNSQKLIQTAMPEFMRQGLSLEGYRIVVVAINNRHVIMFEDPAAPKGQRGSTEKMPTFEVELSEDGASIIRANFSR